MAELEQAVWSRYAYINAQARPGVSHVSAALAAFSTIYGRGLETQGEVRVVLQLAQQRAHWEAEWRAFVHTSGTVRQLDAPLLPVPTNVSGVSAAERFVLTPERTSEVVGRLVTVHNHGNFTDKQQLAWGYAARQQLQPPHTRLLTLDDLDFQAFIERDGPIPTRGCQAFWQRKLAELPQEQKHPEWAKRYTISDSLRKRYQRLIRRKARMGLSL